MFKTLLIIIKTILSSMKHFALAKMAYVKSEFLVFVAAVFSPTLPMLFLIGMMIATDTLAGIWAAIKEGGWNNFKSRSMATGLLPKLIFYPIAILLSQAMEELYHQIPFMKTTGFFIMAWEVRSIGENYKRIFGVNMFDSIRTYFYRILPKDRESEK